MGRSYLGTVAACLGACSGTPASQGPSPVEHTAPVREVATVPGVALVEAEVDGPAYARVSGVATAVDEACYDEQPVKVTGYRDASGRDWYDVRCGRVYVIVEGASETGGVAYRPETEQWAVDAVVVHDLPGEPLLCATLSWHDEEELREGWDTVCLRRVGDALVEVFRTADTSLADGTTSSYEVVSGETEEVLAIVDCDDCEVCALEDDCTAVPPGVQRYVQRHVWNGTAFVARGELSRQ